MRDMKGKFFRFLHPICKGKSKSQPFAHTFALTGRVFKTPKTLRGFEPNSMTVEAPLPLKGAHIPG